MRLAAVVLCGGDLDGRRYEPPEVVAEVLIGSDPDCHLVVDRLSVSPIHARIWADLGQSTVYDTRAPRGLWVNAVRVEGEAPIGAGDVLWLGPPEDPESAEVQLVFEPWVEVLPSAPTAEAGSPTSLDDYEPVVLDGEEAPPEVVAPHHPPEATPDAPAVEPAASSSAVAVPAAATAVEADGASVDPFYVEDAAPAVETAGPAAPTPPPATPVPSPAPEESVPVPAPPMSPPVAAPPALDPSPVPEFPADDEWRIAEPADAEKAGVVPAEPMPDEKPPAAGGATAKPVQAAAAAAPAPQVDRPAPPAPTPRPTAPVKPAARPPASRPSGGVRPSAAPGPSTAAPAPEPPPVRGDGVPTAPPAAAEAVRADRPRPAEPRPRPPATAPRPGPVARRPPIRPVAGRRPARGAPAGRMKAIGLVVGGSLAAAAVAVAAWALLAGGVRLDRVEPARLRTGQQATLTGAGFAPEPAENTVLFDRHAARVLRATPTQIEVEVPEMGTDLGAERRVSVVVRRGRRTSGSTEVVVLQGPRLHGLSPEAAMPGDIVLVAGVGFSPDATVRFGETPAGVVEADAGRIRVTVPEVPGGPGTLAPVVVTVAGVDSNPAPFVLGHVPVVIGVAPATAAPGDVLRISGLGFDPDPSRDDVRVGGRPALVTAAAKDVLSVVVPWAGPGEPRRPIEVRLPGSTEVGTGAIDVTPGADPVAFRFAAEPFTAAPGRPHAVLSTAIGPAFVLAASGGKTAGDRALLAQGRLNDAAQALRTTLGLTVEARNLDSSPVIGLTGGSEVLLEVTAEDAAAYGEDWSGLRGRGGPVTPARLALWWEAVARDLVLLTVRGEKPHFAAELAGEGRAFQQLFDAAQRTGRPGVPMQVVNEARPALRNALDLVAFRVPAAVRVPGAAPSAPAASTPAPARLQLEGRWSGSEIEQGQRRYLTAEFRRGGGSISYEGGITLTVPLMTVEQPRRDEARFSVQIRGGVRHYSGKWDGERLAGSISTDSAGRNVVATFELRPR
jgi:hypothetical protein